MLVVRSEIHDPYLNIAAEEVLLSRAESIGPVLFLWQSQNAVIIGKNQNPWTECRLVHMKNDGVDLVRRFSGGGTVYHDKGNLNFTFLISRMKYDETRQFRAVIQGLKQLGLRARISGKNSISVSGRKVSGNAFCFRAGTAMHHGTLLVSADLAKMGRYLRIEESAVRTRAIVSVPAEVANLSELEPGVGLEDATDAIVSAFLEEYGEKAEEAPDDFFCGREVTDLRRKYMSWEWKFGLTPVFDLDTEKTFPWGTVHVRLRANHGMITSAQVRAIEPSTGAEILASELQDVRYAEDEIRDRFARAFSVVDPKASSAVAEWLMEP